MNGETPDANAILELLQASDQAWLRASADLLLRETPKERSDRMAWERGIRRKERTKRRKKR